MSRNGRTSIADLLAMPVRDFLDIHAATLEVLKRESEAVKHAMKEG